MYVTSGIALLHRAVRTQQGTLSEAARKKTDAPCYTGSADTKKTPCYTGRRGHKRDTLLHQAARTPTRDPVTPGSADTDNTPCYTGRRGHQQRTLSHRATRKETTHHVTPGSTERNNTPCHTGRRAKTKRFMPRGPGCGPGTSPHVISDICLKSEAFFCTSDVDTILPRHPRLPSALSSLAPRHRTRHKNAIN